MRDVILTSTLCSGILLLAGCGDADEATGTSVPSQQQSVALTKDIVYRDIPGVNPTLLSLDIYTPAAANGSNPVMIMIHGGSFVRGDKAGDPPSDRPPLLYPKMEYYTGRGWLFVSINYRLTDRRLPLGHPQQVTHPAHVEDAAAAVAWVLKNIGRYGGDPHRTVVVGHSAGAQLAALLATDQRRLSVYGNRASDLAAVIALDGIYDVPEQMPRAAPFMPLVFGDHEALWRDASPLFHIENSEPVPPILIVYNAIDADNMPQSQTLSFGTALHAAGINAETYDAGSKSHDEIGTDLGKSGDPLSDKVDEFLKRLGL